LFKYKKVGERLASRIESKPRTQAGYLVAYFGLLLLSIGGLLVQGEVWLFAGFLCWFGATAACFSSTFSPYQYTKFKRWCNEHGGYLGSEGERRL
jgi:hypothetical protein